MEFSACDVAASQLYPQRNCICRISLPPCCPLYILPSRSSYMLFRPDAAVHTAVLSAVVADLDCRSHAPSGENFWFWLTSCQTVKWHTAFPVTTCTSTTQSCQSACLHPPWQTWGRESQVGASPDVTQLRCSLTRWTSLTLLLKYDDRNPPDSLVCILEVIEAIVSVSGEIREPCSVNLPLVMYPRGKWVTEAPRCPVNNWESPCKNWVTFIQILVFRFFQAPVSTTQHKNKNSVLLDVVYAHSEQSQNMLAVAA